MKKKLLYVEDEQNLGKIVHDTLRLQNFEVIWKTDGGKVLDALTDFTPDLCVLDIMLPNVDGYELCKNIRGKFPSMPIIFLTAKVNTEDVVKGFESGGTEYIRKPFSIEELIVRINNQLNIHQATTNSTDTNQLEDEIKIGGYTYFPKRYELISPAQETIKLSSREGELLWHMMEKGNQIIDRKEILLNIWGDDSFFQSRNLDVYIKKLRIYFEEDPGIEIQTLRGKGYLFLVKE